MNNAESDQLYFKIYINLQKIFRCLNIGRVFQGKNLPITITQMRALSLFNEAEVVNITDISRSLGMSLQSATNLVRRLELAGYLERSKNKKDKRISEVRLTAKGKQRLNFFRKGELGSIQHLLDGLDPFEGKVLNEALTNASLLFEKAIIESGQEKTIQDAGEKIESETIDHQHP
ncbi:MAG: MarR family transcriptional regulator [Bacteroidetes bacterium]|nr:MAG: MarR family transcriptional regulator [Bacteroidota bacterium]